MKQTEGDKAAEQYLDALREMVTKRIQEGEKINATAYIVAISMHLGEMLWVLNVPLDAAIYKMTDMLRSSYEQCNQLETQGAGNAMVQ